LTFLLSKVERWGFFPILINMSDLEKPRDFETALAELDKLLEEMENQEVSLEQLVEKYRHGAELLKFCRNKLSVAEEKIEQISREFQENSPTDGATTAG